MLLSDWSALHWKAKLHCSVGGRQNIVLLTEGTFMVENLHFPPYHKVHLLVATINNITAIRVAILLLKFKFSRMQ